MKSLKKIIKSYCPEFILNFYNNYSFFKELHKKRLENKSILSKTKKHYYEVQNVLIKKSNIIIRFASYVIYDSTFCGYGLMDLMLSQKNKYCPKIVIIPDISRGEKHLIEQYKKTKNFFINKYGKEYVIDGYDLENNQFIDVSNQFDIVYCANPYDSIVNKVHSIQFLSQQNLLPIYISYGCYVDKYGYNSVMPLLELSLFWKVFADNKITYNDYKKYELLRGKNVVLSGYAKMDELNKYEYKISNKKTIILAPHHTINMDILPLSNFLQYSDFILELPKKYPNINFIFRPHPLLFTNMINYGYWTENDLSLYIKKLEKVGITYSYGGDYLEIFSKSDAIIHDCASFITEYLYTDKPCCFLAKNNYKKYLSKLGNACLKYYYIAFNKDQIFDFIDKVVIENNDKLYKRRKDFSKKKITINYPNVSKKILDVISIIK